MTSACVFCKILNGELTPEAVAFRDSSTAVFPSLHQRPQNQGHMLVVPVAHIPYIYEIDREQGGALLETVARVARAVKAIGSADGVVVRQNNEAHGDQDVFHVHFHVIPRFAGDGFNRGDDRYPFGAVEIPYERRMEQANKMRAALGDL